jgi:hypothetical protein
MMLYQLQALFSIKLDDTVIIHGQMGRTTVKETKSLLQDCYPKTSVQIVNALMLSFEQGTSQIQHRHNTIRTNQLIL